jgi:large subunit ribosomal protein L17
MALAVMPPGPWRIPPRPNPTKKSKMRHKVSGRKFDRPTGSRRAMFRVMVTDLLRHGRIVTTHAKVKEIRSFTERMITHGKDGTLHSRRQAAAFITDPDVVEMVFDEIAPRFQDRAGGYTRVVKLGPRKGDAAEMAMLELV